MIEFQNNNTTKSLGDKIELSDFAKTIGNFKTIAVALCGICAITCIIIFFVSVTRLSASAGNEHNRSRAMLGILLSGVGLMFFGGASVLIGIAWNMLG